MRANVVVMMFVLAALGAAFGQDTNFSRGPQYLMTSGSPLFARSISTPSISLSTPPLQVGASDATEDLTAGANNATGVPPSPDSLPKVDLFPIYYGTPPTQTIELSSGDESLSRKLPASISGDGVSQLTTAQDLRERGFGVALAEAAGFSKQHIHRATRVFTNADIERLRQGS